MGTSYAKKKGKRDDLSFVAVPHAVMNHDNFIELKPYSIKLLFDLCSQYKGHNNGDLCATWSIMRKRGWNSRSTLKKSKQELIENGLIVETQIGGLNRPSLYGISWKPIDKTTKDCDWKYGETPSTWRQKQRPP